MANGRILSPPHMVLAAYALLAVVMVPVFPHFTSPNELTRWALAAAIVERSSIEISPEVAGLGPRFEDLSELDGKLFSNKAPGTVLAALPGYLIARVFADAGDLRPLIYGMRWSASTIPLLVLGLVFMNVARRLDVSEAKTASVLFVLLFSTPLASWGLLLFSNTLFAAGLFAAWALLYVFERSDARTILAGACIGLAVSAEYSCVLAALILTGSLAVSQRWRALCLTAAGGLPFALFLAAYNRLAFGGFFRLSYGLEKLEAFRDEKRLGLFGVGAPDLSTFLNLLFDASRGLLIFAPVLVVGLFAVMAARKRLSGPAFGTLTLIPASVILFYSGYPSWHGGWSVGPRYIGGAIPFLVTLLLFAEWRRAHALMSGAAFAATLLIGLTFPFPPNVFAAPWATLGFPLLREGLIAPNLFHLLPVEYLPVIVPWLVVVFAGFVAFERDLRLFLLVGALAWTLAGIAIGARNESLGAKLQRGYIKEVYFERPGALRREVPLPTPIPPRLMQRRSQELILPPGSWPF